MIPRWASSTDSERAAALRGATQIGRLIDFPFEFSALRAGSVVPEPSWATPGYAGVRQELTITWNLLQNPLGKS